jgi:hypothetical protein
MPESEREHAKKDDKLTVLLLLAGSALSGLGLAGLGAAADILLCAGALLAGAGTAFLLPARPAASERIPAARVQRPQALPGRPQVWMRIELSKGLAPYLPDERIEGVLHVVSNRDLRCDEVACEILGFEAGAAGKPLYTARAAVSGPTLLSAWVWRSFRFSIDPPLLQRPTLLSALGSTGWLLRFTLRAGALSWEEKVPVKFASPPPRRTPPLPEPLPAERAAPPGELQIRLSLELDREWLAPGDRIEGTLHVFSSEDLRCDEISCKLTCTAYTEGARAVLYEGRRLLSDPVLLPAGEWRSFRFSIDPPPLPLPPTRRGALERVEWELQFEIYAEGRTIRSKPVSVPMVLIVHPIRPAREILEGVVASVLEMLGFEARANVKRQTVYGSSVEVDVWAEGGGLAIYVSCKNKEEPVGADVIHQEAGRVSSLREEPGLKVIVAPKFTRSAKAAARASGFAVAELGEKATEENAAEVYRRLYEFFKYQIAVHSASEAYRKRKGVAARGGGLL